MAQLLMRQGLSPVPTEGSWRWDPCSSISIYQLRTAVMLPSDRKTGVKGLKVHPVLSLKQASLG